MNIKQKVIESPFKKMRIWFSLELFNLKIIWSTICRLVARNKGVQMPYTAAESMLTEIWGDRGLPIDPVWIAKQLGIEIVEANLPENVSGALIKETGKDPLIVLCASDSKNRKRFTCAHEIGHYINRQRNGTENYEFVDLRDAMSSTGQEAEEVYANRFAAQLLMPEQAVMELYRNETPSIVMAFKFGVSDEAMKHRLNFLKLNRLATA